MKSIIVIQLIQILKGFLICQIILLSCDGKNRVLSESSDTSECVPLAPPYIYLTLHEGGNIMKFSRNGCLLDENILTSKSSIGTEFRSLIISSYEGKENYLYVAEATGGASGVRVYDTCNDLGKRNYIGKLISQSINEGIDHTYGICFDSSNEYIYISNQHTDNVLRFSKSTFKPIHFPPIFDIDKHTKKYFDGTFKQFGKANVHKDNERGIRSIITIKKHEMWIANEDFDGIIIVNLNTGLSTDIVRISKPVGLFYDESTHLVYVSSKGKHRTGSVYAISAGSLRIVKSYFEPYMEHPTGVLVYGGILYVVEQVENAILTFDVESTKYLGKIVKHIPHDFEQITLSYC